MSSRDRAGVGASAPASADAFCRRGGLFRSRACSPTRWTGSCGGAGASPATRASCRSRSISAPSTTPGCRWCWVRGGDGLVRTFYNVCPHRGARLFNDLSGNAERKTCFFHHWTFDWRGSCVARPRPAQPYEDAKLTAEDCGLREVRTETLYGLVFLQPRRRPGSVHGVFRRRALLLRADPDRGAGGGLPLPPGDHPGELEAVGRVEHGPLPRVDARHAAGGPTC